MDKQETRPATGQRGTYKWKFSGQHNWRRDYPRGSNERKRQARTMRSAPIQHASIDDVTGFEKRILAAAIAKRARKAAARLAP